MSVRLYHPVLKTTIEATESAATIHMENGWVEAVEDQKEPSVPPHPAIALWRNKQLIEACEAAGLDTVGTDSERAKRLRAWDAKRPAVDEGGS